MAPDTAHALPSTHHATLYFDSGSAALPADANDTLAQVIDTLKADSASMAVVSGFHDASGDPAMNAELSRQRAQNVANALAVAGIDPSRVDLQKPALANGGNEADARRVEVSVH